MILLLYIIFTIYFQYITCSSTNVSSSLSSKYKDGKPFLKKYHNLSIFDSMQKEIDCISINGNWQFNPSIQYTNISCKSFHSLHNCNNSTMNNTSYKYDRKINENKCNIKKLEYFSVENLCLIMNGKSMLIVGDSISQDFFFQLIDMLSKAFPFSKCLEKDLMIVLNKMISIPCSSLKKNLQDFQIIFVRNVLLYLRDE